MDCKKRFLDAITLKECESLSHGDVMIHDQLVAEMTNVSLEGDDGNALAKWMMDGMSEANFQRHLRARKFLGIDWCHLFPMEKAVEKEFTPDGHTIIKDIWGSVQIGSQESSDTVSTPIKTPEDVKNYSFPKVESFGYENIKRWIDEGSFAVVAQLDTGFFKAYQLTGFEEYMDYIYFHKSRLHELMEKFLDFQKSMVSHLAGLGVDVIWLGDDFCFNAGPFISPQFLQEFDFDYMKRLVSHIHSCGIPVILHCCGNINYTIRQMVETGVNAIHSMQPNTGNDIYAYKKEYGKDVCLIGNVDIIELMPHGSPFEVDKKVQEMVGGLFYDRKGWVLSTTNLLSVDTPVENAITLHLAAEKYGNWKGETDESQRAIS